MAAEKGKAGTVVRLKALLSREDWIYLSSLLVPVFVYNVALKVVRVATQFEPPGPLGFLDQIRSDILFNLGYAVVWIGLFTVAQSRILRLIVLGFFHVCCVVIVVLTTSTHIFFEKTGSMLGLSFLVDSLFSFGEIREVVASETTILNWLAIPVAFVYGTAGPAIVSRLLTYRWRLPTRNGGRARRASMAACLAALAFFSLSLLPSTTGAGNAFSRDAVANMVVRQVATPEIEARLTADALPTDTEFVKTQKTTQRNVVIVFLESTRAQSTTPYNEDVGTTLFLNELAHDSLAFRHAYAVVPHTSKALVASLCGVPPPLDTDKTESEPNIIPARCLPDLLKEHGYRSAFFQSATEEFERRPQLVENFGYKDFFATEDMSKEGFDKANYFGYEDNIMLAPSEKWLQENGDKPFLATYLTVTSHHDYVVPDRYGKKRFVKNRLLNRYLNTVRYQDFFLMNLFEQYKRLGLYRDTIFIVLGDHGEGFGEHGLKQHDNTIYNEGLHIPLIIHQAGRWESGEWVEEPVDELDILPTVANLLGYRVAGGAYPGASMLSPPEQRTLRASCYHEDTCMASIRGDEKYIYHYGNRAEEFFDLSKDPRERNNIIERQDEERIEALRRDLLKWEARIEASYARQTPGEKTTPKSE